MLPQSETEPLRPWDPEMIGPYVVLGRLGAQRGDQLRRDLVSPVQHRAQQSLAEPLRAVHDDLARLPPSFPHTCSISPRQVRKPLRAPGCFDQSARRLPRRREAG